MPARNCVSVPTQTTCRSRMTAMEASKTRLRSFLPRKWDKSVAYTWWAQRRGFIRNTLNSGKCSTSGEQLTNVIDLLGVIQASGINFLAMTVKHSVHHRGQLSTYLHAMGGSVPGIYGPSADTQ